MRGPLVVHHGIKEGVCERTHPFQPNGLIELFVHEKVCERIHPFQPKDSSAGEMNVTRVRLMMLQEGVCNCLQCRMSLAMDEELCGRLILKFILELRECLVDLLVPMLPTAPSLHLTSAEHILQYCQNMHVISLEDQLQR